MAFAEEAQTVIDWSKGDAQETNARCGDIRLDNLKPGKSYLLWLKGEKPGVCRFIAPGLTFRYPPSHGPTLPGSTTLYGFARIGNNVLVTWVPGY